MRLHEVEGCGVYLDGLCRVAVAGGWLYGKAQRVYRGDGSKCLVADFSAPATFVPDSTAEHVTHGAGGAAADAIYREAVGHCWKVVNEWAKRFGAPLLERAELHDALKELRFNGSTSQTGEG